MPMKTLITACALAVAAGTATAGESNFDVRVSEARRHMRAACQAVQKLPKASASEAPALERTAASEVATAVDLWTAVAKEFSTTVPAGYAGEPGWAQRLEDVRLDLVRMQHEIGAGQWRPAFLSCAHACTWITMMHEANGVTLAIDAMATLRKKVGFLKGLLASAAPDRARPLVKDVLAARDAVLLAPPPEGPTRDAYLVALPELSHAVDAVADAARAGADLKAPVAALAAVVERVYELSI
jgi:hypothetical protein